MRILVVTNMYPSSDHPSYGCFVKSQVDSLTQKGLSIDLIFVNGKTSRFNYLRGAWQVFWKSLLNRYDIVHAHYGLSGPLARCQLSAPVVISFCGSDVMDPAQGRISRMTARLANLRIVKSQGLGRTLGVSPFRVVPNGLDLDLFRPMDKSHARKKLGLPQRLRYILFVGDPERKEKRFDVAEKACQMVRSRLDPAAKLLVLHGRPQREVPLYMNACDLLLLTSDYEGSPNVVKEAMACNLPIVSTDVGDVRQLVVGTRNCRICPQDPAMLAEGLMDILNSGARTDGREKVLHLGLEKIADELIAIYRELSGRKGRSSP